MIRNEADGQRCRLHICAEAIREVVALGVRIADCHDHRLLPNGWDVPNSEG